MSPGFIWNDMTFEVRRLWPTIPARQNTLGAVPLMACTSILPTPQNWPWPSSSTLRMPTAAPRVARSSLWHRIRMGSTERSRLARMTSAAFSAATQDSKPWPRPSITAARKVPLRSSITKLSPQTDRPLKGRLNAADFISLLGTGR